MKATKGGMSGRTKSIRIAVIVAAFVLLGAAVVYVYSHTTINVTEPCRRNAAGEEVCPPPYKP
jgi:flagellar basal body-associated protein FliL